NNNNNNNMIPNTNMLTKGDEDLMNAIVLTSATTIATATAMAITTSDKGEQRAIDTVDNTIDFVEISIFEIPNGVSSLSYAHGGAKDHTVQSNPMTQSHIDMDVDVDIDAMEAESKQETHIRSEGPNIDASSQQQQQHGRVSATELKDEREDQHSITSSKSVLAPLSDLNPQFTIQILVDLQLHKIVQYQVCIGPYILFYLSHTYDIFGLNSWKAHTGEDKEGSRDCQICFEAPAAIIALPCRHCAVCHKCFAQMDKCPMCRKDITQYLKWQINLLAMKLKCKLYGMGRMLMTGSKTATFYSFFSCFVFVFFNLKHNIFHATSLPQIKTYDILLKKFYFH
ncbi:hypothetical protein RFI_02682, partial [Reticulomyxa filosa]